MAYTVNRIGDKVDFRTATDALSKKGVSLQEIADALGVSYATVKQARMDPSSSSYRTPPEGWAGALVELARKRGTELVSLSVRLKAGAKV